MRRTLVVAAATLLAPLAASCGSGDAPEPLTTACTVRVNDRITAGNGLESPTADVLAWLRDTDSGRTPEHSPADLADRARRIADDLRATVDRLAEPASHVDGGTDWLDTWRDTADRWSSRADAFAGGPGEVRSVWFGDGPLVEGSAPPLPFAERDCRLAFAPPAVGALPDDFTPSATTLCSRIVDEHHADSTFRDGAFAMLTVVGRVIGGEPPRVDAPDAAAISAAADLWDRTADEFAAIPDPTPEQQGFVDSVAEYAAAVRQRAAAVDAADHAAIRTAFSRPLPDIAPTPQLADRDCRLLAAHGADAGY